jgi:hypothetical protein
MCTTRRCSSTSFEGKLGNPSLTCFVMKEATGCRCVSSHHFHLLIGFEVLTDKLPPTWFWGPKQETVVVILYPKSPNCRLWSWGLNQETVTVILRPKSPDRRPWFWGSKQETVVVVLRLNRKTHASRLFHVYDVNHTWCQPTSWSSDHWVPGLCLMIPDPPHQVSYSCLIPHRCPPCRIHHLHIMRQANTFLHTE